MISTNSSPTASTVIDGVRATRDVLCVRRVFGEPDHVDGVTIIPVANVAGGAGGGGGEGTDEGVTGSGFGTGFGMRAHPVGVYVIDDHEVRWRPAVDVTRLAHGGQVLAGIFMVCVTFAAVRFMRPAC